MAKHRAPTRTRARGGAWRSRELEAARGSRARPGPIAAVPDLSATGCLNRIAAMRVISGDDIARALTFPHLINALEQAFRGEIEVPVRHHHRIGEPDAEATLLVMPAWNQEFLGCKLVTVFPQNAARRIPSVSGTYLLMSSVTGEPLATIDGRALTAWRTAAASALAAKYLARPDAERLLMIGAGALAPHLVRAHASVRPIRHISLWNRTRSRAEALAYPLVWDGYDAAVGDDLPILVREADVVCCAT